MTLDDDLAEALNRKARLSGRSFKAVVNEAIRRGLAHGRSPDSAEAPPFSVSPQACGLMAGIDPLRFNQLLDQLEIESFTHKHTHQQAPQRE